MTDARCDLEAICRNFYTWDNWIAYDEVAETYHRYLLTAPRTGAPEGRHTRARIRLAISSCGTRWRDRGEALIPGPPGSPDDVAVWTGTTVIREHRRDVLYTGVSQGSRLWQSICLATATGGGPLDKRPSPVLTARDELGYDTGDDDGVVMAWRDPHVAREPATGDWHMVFACKRASKAPRGAVGHAVATGDSLEHWELCGPLELPERFSQVEVPSLVFAGGAVYCFVSTKDRDRDEAAASGSAWRVYAAPSVAGPWERAADGPLAGPSDAVYGARPFHGPRELGAVAFYAPEHPRAFTPTPIAPLSLSPRPALDLGAWL